MFKATQQQLESVGAHGVQATRMACSGASSLSAFTSEKGREGDEQFKRLVPNTGQKFAVRFVEGSNASIILPCYIYMHTPLNSLL